VGLERGPLSFVSTTEELLERKSSGSGLKIENTAAGIRRAGHTTSPQKSALVSPDNRRSLGWYSSLEDRVKSQALVITVMNVQVAFITPINIIKQRTTG
jgi:hypothetical protein